METDGWLVTKLKKIATTVNSVADAVENFTELFSRLEPYLKHIIDNASTEDIQKLRDLAMECVSLIGLAMGDKKFMLDATKAMEHIAMHRERWIQGMWAYILSALLKAIDSGPEQEVQVALLNMLVMCINAIGTGCLSDEMMAEVLRILNKLLTEHFERVTDHRQKRAAEDSDEVTMEVVEEQLADEDNDVLLRTADVLQALLIAYHESFFPHLDSLLPHLVQLLAPGRPYVDLECALCIFDDVIEFGGPACVKYQDIFLEPMLNGLRESVPLRVRHLAAYGCGVLAQFGGPQFAVACARAVPLLAAFIAEPDARSVEKLVATECAIAAVSKIIKYNHSQINRDEIISHWLTWLPVVDAREAPHVYSLLCELVASGHAALATPDAPQRVIAALAEAFLRGAVFDDDPVYAQMVALVRQIQSNGELFNSCLMQLSNEHKEALRVALST